MTEGRLLAVRQDVENYSDEWYTPPHVFKALALPFDLDPAAPAGGVPWIPAARSYCQADRGLEQPWEGRVWLNPPYSEIAAWTRRLARHGNGIALVFARTDTEWWQEAIARASGICFIRGRLTFVRADGSIPSANSGAPSCLIAYGDDCGRAVADAGLGPTFRIHGHFDTAQGELWEEAA